MQQVTLLTQMRNPNSYQQVTGPRNPTIVRSVASTLRILNWPSTELGTILPTHYAGDPTHSVQFSFTGIALSVFCILPPKTAEAIVTTYDLTFILDGQPVGPPFTRTNDQLTDSYQLAIQCFSFFDEQPSEQEAHIRHANGEPSQ
ncbi:hypothetical protein E1B28_007372 [Marasmius oreades]|uniref:Uncharacterized protein n=1 Tax=Marasmius oreades TaxID=181124 RepID=A0A9P7S388_9AGAR|nr:uncharacterized protein E1B28_007372 [Marasmius oreades]KAG7093718.1 hypothetical protein E1B28_007372 [Marasmius oreades]